MARRVQPERYGGDPTIPPPVREELLRSGNDVLRAEFSFASLPTTRPSRTVMVVDDEVFVREVVSEVLRECGCVVIAARNAEEAMRAFHASRESLDLLPADVVLPGSRGRALAGAIRSHRPGVKVILMSGHSENTVLLSAKPTTTPRFCRSRFPRKC
jgi:CheY-like chemotaxis protein